MFLLKELIVGPMCGIQKESLGTETSTSMSKVLALAVHVLVPLRPKTVNGYLVKFPGQRCEQFPQELLDVVVRGESFAPQSLF